MKGKKNKRKQISLSRSFLATTATFGRVQFFISNLHKREATKKSRPMRCSWNWLYEKSYVNYINYTSWILLYKKRSNFFISLFNPIQCNNVAFRKSLSCSSTLKWRLCKLFAINFKSNATFIEIQECNRGGGFIITSSVVVVVVVEMMMILFHACTFYLSRLRWNFNAIK